MTTQLELFTDEPVRQPLSELTLYAAFMVVNFPESRHGVAWAAGLRYNGRGEWVA